MRLFVALELPAPVLAALAAATGPLRARLPPARWLPAASLHLTLVFLGETDAGELDGLNGALGQAFARHPPLRLQLAGGGTFPRQRPARVAWAGLRPDEGLMRLQAEVAAAVARQLGRPAERRPFHPHLTLVRCKRPWPAAATAVWSEALAGDHGPDFEVLEGVLKSSRLSPAGARYETLRSFALSGRGGA